MITGWRVEQLFVRRAAGRITLLAVLENLAGARRREEVPTPATSPEQALQFLARHLAHRHDVEGVTRLRVREERGGTWHDRPEWRAVFRDAFDEATDAEDDGV